MNQDTVVVSAFDEKYAELGKLTTPLMQAFAMAHYYMYNIHTEKEPDMNPMWWKIHIVYSWLARGYRVIWIDADQVVMRIDLNLDGLVTGLHISQDWGHDALDPTYFSAGAFVACPDTLCIFRWCLEESDRFEHLSDQEAMRACYKEREDYRPLFRLYPRRMFNSVHPDISPGVVNPYRDGDWLCHLTMAPLEKRIELFHKLRENRT